MAIKKTYVSDLSGDAITEANPSSITLQRSVRKKSPYGNYTNYENKKIHLTKEESETIFTSEIRQWLGLEKTPAPVKETKTKAKKS